MRLKNFVLSLEAVQAGTDRAKAPDGVVEIANSSALSGSPKDIGFGIFTMAVGSNEALADYSHFNTYSVRTVLNNNSLVFSGSLSSPTENSKSIEGSVLLVASQ
tara:strand:+ start:120 stop:431 length:312 start_codon:yes stop_codon:yes gene_type:complete